MPKDVRVAVLVSGGGSNLGAILEAQKAGQLGHARVALVLSSKADALALTRAKQNGIETAVVDRKAYASDEAAEKAILDKLESARVDVVCLAGYMRKVGPGIVKRFRGRMLNIHPALLPKFGGAGLYGHYVHEAVLAAHEKESGCTIHVVDEEYDHGPILAQMKVPVLANDTPKTLAARVLEKEHELYPKVLKEFAENL